MALEKRIMSVSEEGQDSQELWHKHCSGNHCRSGAWLTWRQRKQLWLEDSYWMETQSPTRSRWISWIDALMRTHTQLNKHTNSATQLFERRLYIYQSSWKGHSSLMFPLSRDNRMQKAAKWKWMFILFNTVKCEHVVDPGWTHESTYCCVTAPLV